MTGLFSFGGGGGVNEIGVTAAAFVGQQDCKRGILKKRNSMISFLFCFCLFVFVLI